MNLASYIDHTVLKPEASLADIEKVCGEAVLHSFAAVCINPVFVKFAAEHLKGSPVALATVVGFPLGASTSSIKAKETEEAVIRGATEIDMVMAIGLFKSKDFKSVQMDIEEVVAVAGNHPVKVILETCLLSRDEIIKACHLAADSGAAYVKTSTGFGSGGATVEDVRLMKETVGNHVKVKASGGVRTREQALAMIEAGASRIGTSAGVTIVSG